MLHIPEVDDGARAQQTKRSRESLPERLDTAIGASGVAPQGPAARRKIDKLTEQARGHLDEGEDVVAVVLGAYEAKVLGQEWLRTGVFLASDRRLLFYAKKVFGYDIEVFPYEKVSSIELSKGFMGHTISFFASGNKVKMKWINQGDVSRFVEYVRERITGPGPMPGVARQADIPDQLAKLGQLHDAGILTDAEFTAKKRDLLGRL